jgi:hypothetical protein
VACLDVLADGSLEQPANPERVSTRKQKTYVLRVIVRASLFKMFVMNLTLARGMGGDNRCGAHSFPRLLRRFAQAAYSGAAASTSSTCIFSALALHAGLVSSHELLEYHPAPASAHFYRSYWKVHPWIRPTVGVADEVAPKRVS